MAYEVTMGLVVRDQEQYGDYRQRIQPLLDEAGGVFRLDLEVARIVHNRIGADITRLFVLAFPDRSSKERFFDDPSYIAIRSRLFEPAVQAWVVVAEYESPTRPGA